MKAVIFGAGRMGRVIGYAMDKLGYELIVFDTNRDAVGELEALTDKSVTFLGRLPTKHELKELAPNIAISSLPYFENQIAHTCIDAGVRYCDLGGRVDMSEMINKHAQEHATAPVFTDLGLAPGWVNILAEQGYRQVYDATDVRMMVGGIPLHRPKGPLGYIMTWSLDGLLNEYRDDCEILQDGQIHQVPGLSNLELIDPEWEGCVALEAFCTSGGAAHTTTSMQQRGVKNCMYKTLRWRGHHHLLDFLMNKCEMPDEQLSYIFTQSAKYEINQDDVVIIMAEVTNNYGLSWKKEIIVNCDSRFSAMQKSTAFPVSTIASMMAEGVFDNRKVERGGYCDNKSMNLNYSDVPFDEFNKRLSGLLNK